LLDLGLQVAGGGVRLIGDRSFVEGVLVGEVALFIGGGARLKDAIVGERKVEIALGDVVLPRFVGVVIVEVFLLYLS
jgi:hypothetical protein